MYDTIAAAATAAGEAGIGVIRISGPDSFKILTDVFRYKSGKKLTDPDPRRMIYGYISDGSRIIDEAMVVYMKAPHTYTGEDVVEIQCHGSPVTLRQILSLVLERGAGPADRGEFTKRAFLNGRIDLSQAEAVIDVVRARSQAGSAAAVSQLSGRLSSRISSIRHEMADLVSEIAVRIEYPDEDLEEMGNGDIISAIDRIHGEIKAMADTASTGRVFRDGCRIALAGRPNTGKSSLMNALLREERAIVTDIPGTTRDTIEEYADLGGIPVKITDTAGIRESGDQIERIGIEKSRGAIDSSDIVILMLDSSGDLMEEDREVISMIGERRCIAVLNKSDLPRKLDPAGILAETGLAESTPVVEISAINGDGIKDLIEEIKKIVYGGQVSMSQDIMVADARHEELMKESMKSLSDAKNMLSHGEALDFAESDIRSAWMTLGEITGESVNDDIVNEIFSRFCLGK
ncbi:MAG: tRNA uridine-5-carboxymethylaminomethyl(34) synthesis GTPase MnmE [Anaerovoracaceae bacterium]|nr:tRNA uridine-5-carboxymethylaminomethyl(34) synthesis GTPase MnmE [Bacillota bacterium]MDY2670759.1 tRNA uridine-5-carboxymethylaminomethyl(34) synthesis GTPase MnmE [Anaerovoracaceae bacterium]